MLYLYFSENGLIDITKIMGHKRITVYAIIKKVIPGIDKSETERRPRNVELQLK